MGRNTGSHTKPIYLNIVKGKIAETVTAETPGAVKRKLEKGPKTGQDTYELLCDSLSGMIDSIGVEMHAEYGQQLRIRIKDADETFLLTIPVESKFFDHFCLKIQSANFKEPITIAPYSFIPKGESKNRSGLNLLQNSVKLNYFYSDKEPKGKPMPTSDNMDTSDWKIFKIQERKFFVAMIPTLAVGKPETQFKNNTSSSTTTPNDLGSGGQNDDLPF